MKVDQKYPHLLNGKFVNGDTFSLLLKLNCSIYYFWGYKYHYSFEVWP
jgi:hypothetical protein